MDKSAHLAHHGVRGQKWGVKNGPPYPLSREKHNAVVSKADGHQRGLNRAVRNAAVVAAIKRAQGGKTRGSTLSRKLADTIVNGLTTAQSKLKRPESESKKREPLRENFDKDITRDEDNTLTCSGMKWKCPDWALNEDGAETYFANTSKPKGLDHEIRFAYGEDISDSEGPMSASQIMREVTKFAQNVNLGDTERQCKEVAKDAIEEWAGVYERSSKVFTPPTKEQTDHWLSQTSIESMNFYGFGEPSRGYGINGALYIKCPPIDDTGHMLSVNWYVNSKTGKVEIEPGFMIDG